MPADCTSRPTAVFAAALAVCALFAAPASTAEGTTAPSPDAAAGHASPWLEEVRAQRRAWEARRRAAQEAADARRRWHNPWAAAQHEAREQARQRRLDERLERMDRDRRHFRQQGPWTSPLPTPWASGSATPERDGQEPPSTPYPPSGWNNGWYYRGY